MINVKVRLFANLRDNREKEMKISTKKESIVLDIVNDLKISPKDAAIILINGRKADINTSLEDNDILSIFPPIGGG
jgi:molybdopterin synthase sulfur carrier subunit